MLHTGHKFLTYCLFIKVDSNELIIQISDWQWLLIIDCTIFNSFSFTVQGHYELCYQACQHWYLLDDQYWQVRFDIHECKVVKCAWGNLWTQEQSIKLLLSWLILKLFHSKKFQKRVPKFQNIFSERVLNIGMSTETSWNIEQLSPVVVNSLIYNIAKCWSPSWLQLFWTVHNLWKFTQN